MPAAPKKPQDHKPKAEDVMPDEGFVFDHDGETYTSPPIIDVITPAFMRRHRRLDSMDFTFTLLEALFEDQPEASAALDSMGWGEFNAVSESLIAQMKTKAGAALGE